MAERIKIVLQFNISNAQDASLISESMQVKPSETLSCKPFGRTGFQETLSFVILEETSCDSNEFNEALVKFFEKNAKKIQLASATTPGNLVVSIVDSEDPLCGAVKIQKSAVGIIAEAGLSIVILVSGGPIPDRQC